MNTNLKPHEEQIIQAVRDCLCVVDTIEITPESNLASLGADSLDLVELSMDLEDLFEIEIDDDIEGDESEDGGGFESVTVRNLIDLVEKCKPSLTEAAK